MTTSTKDSVVVRCPSCGQLNRISHTPSDKRPICGKCWANLDTPQRQSPPPPPPLPTSPPSSPNPKGKSLPGGGWIIAVCVIGGLIWLGSRSDNTSSARKPSSSQYAPPARSAPIYPVQALPYNGEVRTYTGRERVAPLEIRASSGSHYVVKLVDAYTKAPVMTVFVRSGMTANVDVPLGNYEFRYAAGDAWYGYEHLFGPATGYSKADKLFDFRDTGYEVSGYTVTLYKVPNGNLHTSSIRANEF